MDFDDDSASKIRVSGQNYEIALFEIADTLVDLRFDGRSFPLFIEPAEAGYDVFLEGKTYRVTVEDEKKHFVRQFLKFEDTTGGRVEVKAPMPGLMLRIMVQSGSQVSKGDSLCIIEAMKMENDIRASADGVVKEIFVGEKESIEKDSVIMLLE